MKYAVYSTLIEEERYHVCLGTYWWNWLAKWKIFELNMFGFQKFPCRLWIKEVTDEDE